MKIKNFLTEQTVRRNADKSGLRVEEWLNEKKKWFESKIRVKWSIDHAHGGYIFLPTDEGILAGPVSDDALLSIILAYTEAGSGGVLGYVSYLSVYERLRGMTMPELMMAVKWLERNGKACRGIDRMGKPTAFKFKRH